MLLTLTLLLATLLLAALFLSALLPPRLALRLGAAFNVLQIHSVAIFGIYPSLALLAWLGSWRALLASDLWRWGWMQALLALAAAQAISLAWAPAPLLGLRYLIYFVPLPLAAHGFYVLARQAPAKARGALHLLLATSAFEAVLVVVFRLAPSLELAFLHHPVAALFVSPNTLAGLFDAGRNNVLDSAKSGGFFVNANIAAAFLGVCAMASWYVGVAHCSRLLRAVAVLDWLAVAFTGSKAGLLCALVLPVLLAALNVARNRRVNPLAWIAGGLTIVVAIGAAFLPQGERLLSDYQYETGSTLGSRQQIWQFAVQVLRQHPWAGLGFGGWEQRFELPALAQGFAVSMPPHNSLFILWLQSGVLGLLAGLGFIATLFMAISRALRAANEENRALAMAALGALGWYLAQGMGENFGLIGEIHMTPLIGALLGFLCARHDGLEGQNEPPATAAHCAAAAPALCAL